MTNFLEQLWNLVAGRAPAPVAVRLLDRFDPGAVEGRVPLPPPPPHTEWRFDGDVTARFEAGPEVGDLAVCDGLLVGQTTGDFPVLRLEGPSHADDDLVHAVEIRLRVSAGNNLALDFRGAESVDVTTVAAELQRGMQRLVSPVVPGDGLRSYTVPPFMPIPSADVRHVFVRPTDAPGATFAIESIRVVFEKEYLAGIPSGVGWHGLSEIYRETLVARAPETVRLAVELPERAWLDCAVGTVEEVPITFRVAADGKVLLERTLTTSRRWEPIPVDLTAFAGERIDLELSLRAEKAGAVGLWGAPVVRTSDAPIERPQGFILILADTLRADHLDAYGYGRETAPVLRRLAAEGTRFRDCVAQATWTKVSTPSIMTGLYATSHGVAEFGDRLPNAAITLAEVLRDAGYATLSLSSIPFSGKLTNLQKGFEELHESTSLSAPVSRSSKTAREYVDRLLPWLEAHRDVPFFAFLHVFDPHDPYEPHRPYNGLWGDPARKAAHERAVEEVRKIIADPLLRLFAMPTRDELVQAGFDPEDYVAQDLDWYDGSIRAMDVEIGRLVERLQALGLARKTVMILTSDHGEEFLEHGRMFHGQSVYGELTAVPLVLWAPGRVPAGRAIGETIESIDIMPTVLELLGVPAPPGIQGQSLVGLLDGEARLGRPAVCEKAATSQGFLSPPPRETESVAIVADGWKLIHNTRRDGQRPEYELYDHSGDPLNRTDLAAARPEVVARLAAELEAWRARVAAARLPPDQEATEDVDARVLLRLRALGYVE